MPKDKAVQSCCEKCSLKVMPQINGQRFICRNSACKCHIALAKSESPEYKHNEIESMKRVVAESSSEPPKPKEGNWEGEIPKGWEKEVGLRDFIYEAIQTALSEYRKNLKEEVQTAIVLNPDSPEEVIIQILASLDASLDE